MRTYDDELDVTGTSCPLPLINIAKIAGNMNPGQVLKVTGDDPIFEKNVRDYCDAQNLRVLDVKKGTDRRVTVLIQR